MFLSIGKETSSMRSKKDKKNGCCKMRGLYIVLPSSRNKLERGKRREEQQDRKSLQEVVLTAANK